MLGFHLSLLNCHCPSSDARETALAALLARVGRDRDPAAFAALYRLAMPRCRTLFLRRGVPRAVAEELAQETLAAVWREAPHYDPATHGGALAWLYAVGKTIHDEAWRRYLGMIAAEPLARDARAVPRPPPEAGADAARKVRRLRRALARLPRADLALLADLFVRDLSHAAIAKARGVPIGTVKARTRRALARLRAEVEAAGAMAAGLVGDVCCRGAGVVSIL